jgi:serine/threonine protein kinase
LLGEANVAKEKPTSFVKKAAKFRFGMNGIEQELQCCVCFEPFHEPVTLACGHTLCKSHLAGLAQCPMRCEGEIPAEDAQHVNITLRAIIQNLDRELTRVNPLDITLGQLINRGPTASVFKGAHLGQEVAVKQLYGHHQDGSLTQNQLREIQIVRALNHPNILKTIGTCPPPESYIVTPWCSHGDLGRAIAANGIPGGEVIMKLSSCISEAVTFLHARNILHRDLKPSNVLLMCALEDVAATEEVPCVLADFGSARTAGTATMTGMIGTPAYSAPEILLSSPYGKAADVYSFGCVLHELLSGRPPFSHLPGPMQIMMHVVQGGRLPIDASWSPPYPEVLAACFRDSEARAEIAEVHAALIQPQDGNDITVEVSRHAAGKDRIYQLIAKSTATFAELKTSVKAMVVAKGEQVPSETLDLILRYSAHSSGSLRCWDMQDTATLHDIMARSEEEKAKGQNFCSDGQTLRVVLGGPNLCPVCLRRNILGYARDSCHLEGLGGASSLSNYGGTVVYFFDGWPGPIQAQCENCWGSALAAAGKTLDNLGPQGGY